MPPLGSKWHICLWPRFARDLEVIQFSVDRKVAPTGGPRELDAHLFQGRADPIRANIWVFRELFDFLNRRNINLPELFPRMRLVRHSCKLFFRKPPENGMHGRSTHVQILSNRFGIPSVYMQPHDGSPPRLSICHLCIAWIPSLGCRGFRTRGQNE